MRLLWEQEVQGSNPCTPTRTCRLINGYCDPQDEKWFDNHGWFEQGPYLRNEAENLLQRKLRSNLTGAGNARILPGRGADGAVRDGRLTDAEGVCVERLDAVYEQPRGGSITQYANLANVVIADRKSTRLNSSH